MADVLKAYLAEAGRKQFAWGDVDCFLFVADWVERRTGVDPAGVWRGAYTNPHEARNIVRRNGDALRFADHLLTKAGCMRTEQPDIGDVALVRAALSGRRKKIIFIPVGAIMVRAGMWAIKSAGKSLTVGNFPVIRAWSIETRWKIQNHG